MSEKHFADVSKKDTISRQAAIDTVMQFMPSLTTPDGSGSFDQEIYEAQEMFVDIGQALNNLPSAQPKRGKWKTVVCDGVELVVCSECGYTGAFWTYNYCPNCGADMRGGKDAIH